MHQQVWHPHARKDKLSYPAGEDKPEFPYRYTDTDFKPAASGPSLGNALYCVHVTCSSISDMCARWPFRVGLTSHALNPYIPTDYRPYHVLELKTSHHTLREVMHTQMITNLLLHCPHVNCDMIALNTVMVLG